MALFLDTSARARCAARWAMDYMLKNGLDPESAADRAEAARAALERYYQRNDGGGEIATFGHAPIFHNSGHIQRARRTS